MKWKEKLKKIKKPLLIIAAVLCCTAVIGTSMAYLFTNTDEIENVFTPAEVPCEVEETFENNVKSNVSIKNTGNTDAFIRASIVVTWVDKESGDTLPITPVLDTDYEMTMGNIGWSKNDDGYYYCSFDISPGENTPVLITECKVKDDAQVPKNANLSVEIVASAIQSKPSSVVQDKWGVSLGGNTQNI